MTENPLVRSALVNGGRPQFILDRSVMEAGGEAGLQDEIRVRLEALNPRELLDYAASAEIADRESSSFPHQGIEMTPGVELSVSMLQ